MFDSAYHFNKVGFQNAHQKNISLVLQPIASEQKINTI